MKSKEIRNMTKEDIEKKIKELRLELLKERSEGGTPKNPGRMREIRKDIARLLTVINEKSYKSQ